MSDIQVWGEAELEEKCPELLEDCEDEDRAVKDLIKLLREDHHWEHALINLSTPGGHDFLKSCREQVVTWLNQYPDERDYPSPLSEKQLYTVHDWRGRY